MHVYTACVCMYTLHETSCALSISSYALYALPDRRDIDMYIVQCVQIEVYIHVHIQKVELLMVDPQYLVFH